MESLTGFFSSSPTVLKFSPPKLSTLPVASSSFASISSPKQKPSNPRKPYPETQFPTIPTSPLSSTAIKTTSDATSCVSILPKKALVPIGYGTEEMEAVILIDVLRRAGVQVTVASVEPQLEIEGSAGTRLVADTSISTCSDQVFDLVALPGGMPGSVRLRECETLRNITSKQAEEKRLYGAICAAPAITLLPWGLLRRKEITCHPAFMDKLPTFWAVKSKIKVSGGLTTSRGPGTSFEFALCLVDQLFGESIAKELGESLMLHIGDDKHRKEEFNKVEWAVNHTPRVLVPIANGSEESEVVTIVDILRRAKVEVEVASVESSLQILASQGTRIVADRLIGDAADSTYDIIILPGGSSGTERMQKSEILRKLLQQQNSFGRIYGAVCSSAAVLDRQGLLKDKRAAGEVINDTKVVIDGKLITSIGLGSITDFALAIVSKLFGHARTRSVAEGLVFEYPRS